MMTHGHILGVWLDGNEPDRLENWMYNLAAIGRWLQSSIQLGTPAFIETQARETRSQAGLSESEAPIHLLGHDQSIDETDMIEALQAHGADLLLLPTPSEGSHKVAVGNWRLLPKASPVPTLFIPTDRRLGQPPFSNLIVPVSGELKENLALELGLNIADEKAIPVDLIHISPDSNQTKCHHSLLESIGDEVQHEYAERIEQIVAKGSPFSSLRKKRRIREFRHGFGDVASELKKMIRESPHPLLLVDWSGTLEAGRAETIKDVLLETGVCSLLVRSPTQPKSCLKIGRKYLGTKGALNDAPSAR